MTTQNNRFQWFALQTLSNMEDKVKRYVDDFTDIENMGQYIEEVIVPKETISEVKNGKKRVRDRKLYPGYVFIKMRVYDEDSKVMQGPWYFINGINGVISFIGGLRPVALKQKEIDDILAQMEAAQGTERPAIIYEVGEIVKITDGPFMNLSGEVSQIAPEKGKLTVNVSIFGRMTPVDLEYSQIEKIEA